MEVYVVVEFGCNSGYNHMYTPSVSVFQSREKAYELYEKVKNYIIKMKEGYDIDYDHYEDNGNGKESIIQCGGDEGAKRPIGIMITKKTIQD